MAFTPNEIRNKEFTRVKNGLEPAEVSDFLTQLSNEIERLKEEKKQLEKVLEERIVGQWVALLHHFGGVYVDNGGGGLLNGQRKILLCGCRL